MKYLFLFIPFFLYALDYSSLYSERGKGYENNDVRIQGKFSSYSCHESKRAIDGYCNVCLSVYDNDTYLNRVCMQVGTTYESSFKNSDKDDVFSFDCTYRGNLFSFKGCN